MRTPRLDCIHIKEKQCSLGHNHLVCDTGEYKQCHYDCCLFVDKNKKPESSIECKFGKKTVILKIGTKLYDSYKVWYVKGIEGDYVDIATKSDHDHYTCPADILYEMNYRLSKTEAIKLEMDLLKLDVIGFKKDIKESTERIGKLKAKLAKMK